MRKYMNKISYTSTFINIEKNKPAKRRAYLKRLLIADL